MMLRGNYSAGSCRDEAERREFIDRHGGRDSARKKMVKNGIDLEWTGWWIMPTGAIVPDDPNCECKEPPNDERKLLTLLLYYRGVRQKEALEALNEFKNALRAWYDPEFKGLYIGPSSYNGSQEQALEELDAKVKEFHKWRVAGERAQQKLDALDNLSRDQEDERLEWRAKERTQRLLDRINRTQV